MAKKRKYAISPTEIKGMTINELKTYIRNAGKSLQSLVKRIDASPYKSFSQVPQRISGGQKFGYFTPSGGAKIKGVTPELLRQEANQINWIMHHAENPGQLNRRYLFTNEQLNEAFDTLNFNKLKAMKDEMFSTPDGIQSFLKWWELNEKTIMQDYDSLRGTSTEYDDIADLMYGDNSLSTQEKYLELFDMIANAKAHEHMVKSGKTVRKYNYSNVHTLNGKFKGPKRKK